jgi:hypothetical protein
VSGIKWVVLAILFVGILLVVLHYAAKLNTGW